MPPDDTRTPRRRRLWIATAIAATVLLVFPCYVTSAGPAAYLNGRGWLSNDMSRTSYLPLLAMHRTEFGQWWLDYANRCYELGRRHSGR